MKPAYLDLDFIDRNTDYIALIDYLRQGFESANVEVPLRHHHHIGESDTLLLMPAWQRDVDRGVKIVSVNPNNRDKDIPSIQGTYIYMDGDSGEILAIMDGKALTTRRTAAASALASEYLSRNDSKHLLVVGTGALCPELVKAHCTVRNIERVSIWGRNIRNAEQMAKSIDRGSVPVHFCIDLEQGVKNADIISCATLSKTPLIMGKWLKPGQYVDLVGSYKPDMREADDEVITKASIYVDVHQKFPHESGDIRIPIESGIISNNDIKADLFELCGGQKEGRRDAQEIIAFKSVGHALEDLVAARYYYKYFKNQA